VEFFIKIIIIFLSLRERVEERAIESCGDKWRVNWGRQKSWWLNYGAQNCWIRMRIFIFTFAR
jgi:hypothetical protein